MSTRIAAGIDDLPCFIVFYFHDPYTNIEFLIISFTVVCLFIYFCNISVTGALVHSASREVMAPDILQLIVQVECTF